MSNIFQYNDNYRNECTEDGICHYLNFVKGEYRNIHPIDAVNESEALQEIQNLELRLNTLLGEPMNTRIRFYITGIFSDFQSFPCIVRVTNGRYTINVEIIRYKKIPAPYFLSK